MLQQLVLTRYSFFPIPCFISINFITPYLFALFLSIHFINNSLSSRDPVTDISALFNELRLFSFQNFQTFRNQQKSHHHKGFWESQDGTWYHVVSVSIHSQCIQLDEMYREVLKF